MPGADPGPALDVLREGVVKSLDEVFDGLSCQKTREGGDGVKDPGVECSKPGGKRADVPVAGGAPHPSRRDVLGLDEHLQGEHEGHQQRDKHNEREPDALRVDASHLGASLCEDANDQRDGQRREKGAHGEEGEEKCGSGGESGRGGKREGNHGAKNCAKIGLVVVVLWWWGKLGQSGLVDFVNVEEKKRRGRSRSRGLENKYLGGMGGPPPSLGAIVCLICYCGLNVYYCVVPRRRRGHVCPLRVPFELGLCPGGSHGNESPPRAQLGDTQGRMFGPFQDLELFSEVEYLGRHACSISQQQWVQNQYIDHALTNDSESLVTSGIQAVGELWAHHPSRKSSLPHQCAPDLTTDSAVIIVP